MDGDSVCLIPSYIFSRPVLPRFHDAPTSLTANRQRQRQPIVMMPLWRQDVDLLASANNCCMPLCPQKGYPAGDCCHWVASGGSARIKGTWQDAECKGEQRRLLSRCLKGARL